MRISRIEKEKKIVEIMIRLYCLRKEGNRELCGECTELLEYACFRLESCPFGQHKTSCKHCPVHCYQPGMRKRMQQVMRFSGPRMLLYHPVIALKHLFRR